MNNQEPEFLYLPLTNPRTRPFLRNNDERYLIKEWRATASHWTGNTNASADADNNRDYFEETDLFVSAQIIVDDKKIVQTMPLGEVAYHVGGRRYTDYGKELRKGHRSPNYVTVGVETCVNKGADFAAAYQNTLKVFASLMLLRGNTDFDKHITTHNQITGKICPQFPIGKNGEFILMEGLHLRKFWLDVEIMMWGMDEPIPFVL